MGTMQIEPQIQYSIVGSCSDGTETPEEQGFVEDQFELYSNALRYKRLFPRICHIRVDAAFPMEGPNR